MGTYLTGVAARRHRAGDAVRPSGRHRRRGTRRHQALRRPARRGQPARRDRRSARGWWTAGGAARPAPAPTTSTPWTPWSSPAASTSGIDPTRDRDELALARAARRAGRSRPSALCRGLQLLAVATGGSLEPDLGTATSSSRPAPIRSTPCPGSAVAALVPEGRVGSLHHQSVATYDDRWHCTATAPDGVVEALEWADQAALAGARRAVAPRARRHRAGGVRLAGPRRRPARRSPSRVSCLSAAYSPLAYRQTGTATVPPPKVTAS